jgi:hypothetical protein
MGDRRWLFLLLAGLLLAALGLGQDQPGGKEALTARYENKTLYLKIPLTTDSFKAVIAGGRYRILSEQGKTTLFPVGEKVRLTDVNMGGREVKIKIQSLDQRRQAELRFVLSAQGDVFPSADVSAVLSRIFTAGLSYADIEGAKRDYLEDQYNAFVESEGAAADLPPAAIHETILRANPAGRALSQDVHNLQAKVQEQTASIAALEKEKAALNSRLSSLQQEKQILDSAGRDYQDRNRQLQASEADLRRQLQRRSQDLEGITRGIRAAATELGLNASANTPPEDLLQRLSQSYLQLSAGNNAYQARVKQLEDSLAKAQADVQILNATLQKNQQDQQNLADQIQILTTKDKALAQQMLQLQREKSIVQSKLLSQSLLKVTVDRRRTEQTVVYTATLRLKNFDLGDIVVTAPLAVDPAKPTRFTLETRLKSAAELSGLADPDLAMLLKHLKDFPHLDIAVERRSPDLDLQLIQSPERDNTTLWVWEATPKDKQDVDLVVRFSSSIEGEPLPIFGLPLSIPYPTMEKTLVEYFQPVPIGIGVVLGMLVALPFFVIQRRRQARATAAANHPARRHLRLGDKEF